MALPQFNSSDPSSQSLSVIEIQIEFCEII